MLDHELSLVEAIKNLLGDKVSLGLNQYKPSQDVVDHSTGDIPSNLPYDSKYVNNKFLIDFNKEASKDKDCMLYFNVITSSFSGVHSYCSINNPKFFITLNRRFTSQKIPTTIIVKANKIVEDIMKELFKSGQQPLE